MPIQIPSSLPAMDVLESENIFVMTQERAIHQDIRPLKIIILNLMPTKIETETQLLRLLGNSPLQITVDFLQTATHVSKNTPASHLNTFYKTFDEIKDEKYDGMILTGAPVELMPFEEVDYWDELCAIMDWSRTNVYSTMHICWSAQAGLYYHYGIPKYPREKKLNGVYSHKVLHHKVPLVRGLDDYVMCPHSRYTEVRSEDIRKHEDLNILAESEEAGVLLVVNEDGSRIFIQGHPEYDRMTLNNEFHRDQVRGLNPELPCHYYPDDNPENRPVLTWRNLSNTVYANWLNYYVYQTTPYILTEEE